MGPLGQLFNTTSFIPLPPWSHSSALPYCVLLLCNSKSEGRGWSTRDYPLPPLLPEVVDAEVTHPECVSFAMVLPQQAAPLEDSVHNAIACKQDCLKRLTRWDLRFTKAPPHITKCNTGRLNIPHDLHNCCTDSKCLATRHTILKLGHIRT